MHKVSSLSSITHIVDAVIVPIAAFGRVVKFFACDLAAVFTIIFVVLLPAVLLLRLIETIFLAVVGGFLAVITVLAIFRVRALTVVPKFGFA